MIFKRIDRSLIDKYYLPAKLFGRVETVLLKSGTTSQLVDFDEYRFFEERWSVISLFLQYISSANDPYCRDFAFYIVRSIGESKTPKIISIGSYEYCLIIPETFFELVSKQVQILSRYRIFRRHIGIEFSDNLHQAIQNCEIYNLQGALQSEALIKTFSIYAISSLYILFHEFTHVTNGHMEFISNRSMMSKFANEKRLQLRQTLEWDADCGAMGRAIEFLCSPLIRCISYRPLDIQNIAKLLSVSTYLIFSNRLCFDLEATDLIQGTHPPDWLRAESVRRVCADYIERELKIPFDDAQDICMNSVVVIEACLHHRENVAPKYEHFERADDLFALFIRQSESMWSEIRGALQNMKVVRHQLAP